MLARAAHGLLSKPGMNLEQQIKDDVLVIAVHTTRIDASVANDFRDALAKVIHGGSKRFVLDVSRVTFIDSSGLGAIVSILKLAGRSGTVFIAGLTHAVSTLFRVTRMDKVFRLFP